ncbi:MAG: ligase protein [Parcubacteria group bacterium GW2011_GWA2_36_10]|nr:MAG: ligase protein [Parcubacteria group bacterium GW2011_GWA2_36_10]
MTKSEAKLRIAKLINEIQHHRYLYHVQDTQEISDSALDSLKKELAVLEEKFPDLIRPDSPTQRVGGKALQKFKKVLHRSKILSLADAFDVSDLQAWQERNEKILNTKIKSYYSELKMDGLTVVLTYLDGVLATAATRGDGQIGEDVTMNLKTIESIPLRLKPLANKILPKLLEVRGEVVMTKKVFQALNQTQAKQNLPLFANPRNVAAGSIRQLDPQITSSRKLDCLVFELMTDLGQKTHQEVHQLLADLGFKTSPYNEVCRDLKSVNKYLQKWEKKRKALAYDTDGVVVVVNDINQEKILGSVGKADRWMIAYKFPAETTTTKVLAIEVQVGRTGALTPVAILTPVVVAGSIVSRATLHNQDEIERLDVRVGDTVIIQKAGDIIPDIVQVLPKLRTSKEKVFVFPKHCPACKSPVQQKPQEVAWYCPNKKCYAQNIEGLIHFVSKKAFNIEGLGDQIIKQLVDTGLVNSAADIFTLKLGDLEVLERFASKKAQNLLAAIEKSKNIALDRFLYALGIRHVGTETAIILADHFQSLAKWQASTQVELENLNEIGPEVSASIISWLADKNNIELLKNLQKAQINLEYKQLKNNKLNGQSFLFTGSLAIERTEAQNMVRAKGGKIVSSVSKNLDYLVAGVSPGSKLSQAEKLEFKILSEQEFLKLVK